MAGNVGHVEIREVNSTTKLETAFAMFFKETNTIGIPNNAYFFNFLVARNSNFEKINDYLNVRKLLKEKTGYNNDSIENHTLIICVTMYYSNYYVKDAGSTRPVHSSNMEWVLSSHRLSLEQYIIVRARFTTVYN